MKSGKNCYKYSAFFIFILEKFSLLFYLFVCFIFNRTTFPNIYTNRKKGVQVPFQQNYSIFITEKKWYIFFAPFKVHSSSNANEFLFTFRITSINTNNNDDNNRNIIIIIMIIFTWIVSCELFVLFIIITMIIIIIILIQHSTFACLPIKKS